ncbi:hypothetical protein [Aureibacter tunicatorum]|uniref:Uncharacterized protein n=1 Tax=Aureibacter tunicatorum TaxID=866807 RepID=A0AAE4BR82_9BACT|nr:hypothetical protein [Aureibacter tunicatorum]MDR6238391.1 hypothetical protein [Aureibacter tunicatorum]BDD03423.1 hypothetical protein AUTU_09060 [Aureibacter tunicatorum]
MLNPNLKKVFAVGAVLGVVLLSAYYFLGGFEKLDISKSDKREFVIYGVLVEGRYSDPKIEETFAKSREIVEQNHGGSIAIVNYPHENEKQGFVKQFVGVVGADAIASGTDGFTKLVIHGNGAVHVVFPQSVMAMPRPKDVRDQVAAFAKENGGVLQGESIELYNSDNTVESYFPLK